MIGIADLADGCIATLPNAPYFAGGQAHRGVGALLAQQLRRCAGGPCQLAPTPFLQLDVVDHGPQRDIGKREAVARANWRFRTCQHGITHPQIQWRDDVAFFSIDIMQQGQPSRTVRIILNSRYPSRDLKLIPLEIDFAQKAPMPAAAMSNCDAPMHIAPTGPPARGDQRSFRLVLGDVVEEISRHPSASRRRRFVFFQRHHWTPSNTSMLSPAASETIAFL